jgi:hypothetical protein
MADPDLCVVKQFRTLECCGPWKRLSAVHPLKRRPSWRNSYNPNRGAVHLGHKWFKAITSCPAAWGHNYPEVGGGGGGDVEMKRLTISYFLSNTFLYYLLLCSTCIVSSKIRPKRKPPDLFLHWDRNALTRHWLAPVGSLMTLSYLKTIGL